MARALSLDRLSPLFDEKRDEDEGADAIEPPPLKYGISDEADESHHGERTAGQGLDRIGPQGRATDFVGEAELRSGDDRHSHRGENRHRDPEHGALGRVTREKPIHALNEYV